MNGEVVHLRRGVAIAILVVALAAGAVFGTWMVQWAGHKVFGAPAVPVKVAGSVDPVRLGEFANGFASVVQPALPAVVNISTTHVIKVQQGMPGIFNDPFFQQFFGNQFGPQRPQTEKEQSLGSGVIINPDGYILTNNHVVAHGQNIKVVWNNKQYTGKVVGTDPQTDIAVVKIDATGLPTLTFGDSSKLHVGDVVFAIGDPFGIGETATMGIVSATSRANLHIEEQQQAPGKQAYEDFIQTDAAINPGNSGGALIDLRGNLIGINTAILSSGSGMNGEGGNEGIGFAIPINMARSIMEQLIQHGKVTRGYMGAYVGDLTPDFAKSFGYNGGGTGALLEDVEPATPAEKAGLKRGDIVLGLNGESINGAGDLTAKIASTAPGTTIQLKVFRDGKTFTVPVTLGTLPERGGQLEGENQQGQTFQNGGKAMQGVRVENVTPDILQQLNMPPGTKGVVVDSIDQDSPAAGSPLQRGDVIQEVNHKPVNNLSDYRSAIASTDDQPVLLLVRQPNQPNATAYIVVQPNE